MHKENVTLMVLQPFTARKFPVQFRINVQAYLTACAASASSEDEPWQNEGALSGARWDVILAVGGSSGFF